MNFEKVVSGFFFILAFTLNFGFFYGDIDDINLHSPYELFAAIVVNLVATVLKLGDRSHLGAVMLASSLVADLQLISAAFIWGYGIYELGGVDASLASTIVSLSGGALMANTISVVLHIIDTAKSRR